MSTSPKKNKNELQYEELFRIYYSSLCYFAQKYIGDLDSCKDIVHSVFVNIWEKREEFDFDKPAKSYLFTSVYNRCMNAIRDRKKFVDSNVSDMIHDAEEAAFDPDHLETAELESKIWQGIQSLPEKCREVFMLNRFEEKKYTEIADQLSISVKTVEAQMSKALKVLRDYLADYIHLLLFLLLKNLL